LEVSELSRRFFPYNLDFSYNGAMRTLMAKGDHIFHILVFSFEDRFNPAITKVPNPPGYTMAVGYPPSLMSEENPLH